MSLDVYLIEDRPVEIYTDNITHNLAPMAQEAGIYKCMWSPEDLGITKAKQLIEPLKKGLSVLQSDPDRFEKLNPANKWGSYHDLLRSVSEYLFQCEQNPEAMVRVCR